MGAPFFLQATVSLLDALPARQDFLPPSVAIPRINARLTNP
jgi:hypothetical protein